MSAPYDEMALSSVPTEDLKKTLRYVHQGTLACPVTPAELARLGLQDRSEPLLGSLRGLDSQGVRAVLVAVIAERLKG